MEFTSIHIHLANKTHTAQVWQYRNSLADIRIQVGGYTVSCYTYKFPCTLTKTRAIRLFKEELSKIKRAGI